MSTFIDQARIRVVAGSGGKGAMHFRHEKYVPLGGPDGGDGGDGGSVLLRGNRSLNTLYPFQRRRYFQATSGVPGGANRMHGAKGADLAVDVPLGTIARDRETGEVIADLVRDGQSVLVAHGGKGGLGNVHFKSSTNQAPRFAEKGEPGQEMWLDLELKVIADVGLIGLPNAGKSTLLSVITAARPKIADYPFTTLSPNLGVVDADGFDFVVADIPGLIEGAHRGVGLGHDFLRHIERTVVLVHVVDGSTQDPLSAWHQVNDELKAYRAELPDKPQVVVVSKLDLPEGRERFAELAAKLKSADREVMGISAATHDGIADLVYRLAQLVREHPRAVETEEKDVPVIHLKPPPDTFTVERKRRTLRVRGETVERLAAMTDVESEEAMNRLHRRLKRMGVFRALEREGARDGTKVAIGEVEFMWGSEQEAEADTNVEGDARRFDGRLSQDHRNRDV